MSTMTERAPHPAADQDEPMPLEEFFTAQELGDHGEADAADGTTEEGSESSGLTRFLVVGALPGVGASSVAWSIAAAAAHMMPGHEEIHVLDTAAPRRSTLRMIGTSTGLATSIDEHTRLVPARCGRVVTTYIDGRMDTRVDEPSKWQGASAPVEVIDLGLSAEEALSDDGPAAWLTGETANESHVVLVLGSNASTQLRCEALLGEWSSRGWAPIDEIVLVGPASAPVSGTHYMQQAMSAARRLEYLPDLAQHGLPAADAPAAPSLSAWARVGQELAANALELPLPVTGSRRWRKSRP